MRARSVISIGVVLAIIGLLVYGLSIKGDSRVALGDAAPTAPLPQLDGGEMASLADYRGQWVLVNFWASWCVPCREEAPLLEELQQRHGGEEFTVLGFASRDLSSDSRAFVRNFGLTYPQLRDGDGTAAREYGSSGVPETFLIDPQGIVRALFLGPVPEEFIANEIEPLITGKTS